MRDLLLKHLFIATAMLLVSSCGKDPFGTDTVYTSKVYFETRDPFFEEYMKEFESDCGEFMDKGFCGRVMDIPINFVSHEKMMEITGGGNSSVIGLCISNGRRSEILISRRVEEYSYESMRHLVWHEIGHSHYFDKGHDDSDRGYHNVAMPSTIMNSYIFDSEVIWTSYKKQFFSGDSSHIVSGIKEIYWDTNQSKFKRPFNSVANFSKNTLDIDKSGKTYSYTFNYLESDKRYHEEVLFSVKENGFTIDSGTVEYSQIKLNHNNSSIVTPHVSVSP